MLVFAACFLLGLLFGSFAEYAVHRLMHAGVIRGRRHAEHHRDGWAQGFWPELLDYLLPGLPLLLPPWLLGVPAGAGLCAGALLWTIFMAYAHTLQHDNPAACRWMRMPVHYVHHRDQQWRHNFGLAVDWWDRLLGTYRAAEADVEPGAGRRRGGLLDIRWSGRGAPPGWRAPGATARRSGAP